MNPYSSIVVGIDFTPCSMVALEQAMRVAAWSAAKVHLVHVIDTLVVIELEEALSPMQKGIRDGLVADAGKAWKDFARSASGPAAGQIAALPLEVSINNRCEGILRRASEKRADLVILGAFGTKPAEVGIGTVASACVRKSRADVLLVRDTQRGPFRTVVAAVDFSDTSLRAIERTAFMAAHEGAALHLLHVFSGPWHVLHYRAPTVEVAPHFRKQYRDGLERRLVEFCRPALGSLPATRARHVVFDDLGHRSGIVEYASSVTADLIVMGTRGRSNLRDLFLGSTAEKALRDSTCSILAVKPDDAAGG